jgi:hypothetical protein
MSLGVVILHEAVVRSREFGPTLRLREVEVGHPALNVENTPNKIHL